MTNISNKVQVQGRRGSTVTALGAWHAGCSPADWSLDTKPLGSPWSFSSESVSNFTYFGLICVLLWGSWGVVCGVGRTEVSWWKLWWGDKSNKCSVPGHCPPSTRPWTPMPRICYFLPSPINVIQKNHPIVQTLTEPPLILEVESTNVGGERSEEARSAKALRSS